MSGWETMQIRAFADQFVRDNQGAWPVLVLKIREALLDAFVLKIVLSQQYEVTLKEIRDLQRALFMAISKQLPF